MGVYKEGKNWKVQVYYKDWQGNQKRKQKRGFRTKGEAKEWERDFLQQQSQGVDIEFGNFLEIYYKDMDVRLREHTMYTKRYIIDLKIRPYFEKKILSEITVADVRAWQNELLMYKDKNGKGYSQTYLKTINCQLTAIFNYAIRYYNLQDNPCRKAGAIGKSKGEPKDFWLQEEFNDFLETVSDKPETRMAFLLLYWTGMRIGELLALTYNDINLEEKTISINKSYQRLKGKDMITQPKTPKSIRVITMPDFLAEEFREYCSHLYGIMKKERLFRFTKSHMEHCMAAGIERSGVKRIRLHDLRHPYVKHTTKIFSLRLMDFQAQAYPDARRKTRGACQLHRGGQSRSPVRPLCNRKRFSCLPPQSKMSWILYAISMRLSGYTSTRSISSSASSVVSVSASKSALDASLRLSCRACSSCFCFACANTAA